MKKLLKLLFGAVILFSISTNTAKAYDFSAVNSDGQTLYYNITSSTNHTVAITYGNYNYFSGYSISGVVTIPSSVTHNGINYSVTTIGYDAFHSCTSLTSVAIPNSVTSIGSSAFAGCTGLTSVTIGNSVTSIGNYAFAGCTGLTTINVDNANTCYSSLNGVLYSKLQDTLVCYPAGKQGSFTIPNSVTSIGNMAFYGCTGLTSVTIPNSVISIGDLTFDGCTGLTSIINMRTAPQSIVIGGFSSFQYVSSTIPVYVPCSSVSTYQSSSWGTTFSNIRGYTADTINAVYLGQPYTQNGFNVTQAGMYIKIDTTLSMTGTCYNATILNFHSRLETNLSTNITQTKAKLNAYLYSPFIATAKGFQYKINWSTSNYTTINGLMSLTDTTAMYYNLTNLIPNTTYSYRAFAVLVNGDTLFGAIKTFRTLTITVTPSISNVTQTKAKLNATFGNSGDAVLTSNRGFQYGNTTINGIISSIDTNAIYANLTNLIPNTTYKCRAFAILSNGDTLFGNIICYFTTLPITITTSISNITQTKAKLNATFGNSGDAVLTSNRGFQYGNTTINGIISSIDTNAIYANLTNLIPNTTYQCRAFAVLSSGDTLFGEIKTFTTLPITITISSSNITQTKATLNATFGNSGDAVLTLNRGFKYGNAIVNGILSSTDTTTMYSNLTNLIPNTTYSYKAFAVLVNGDTLFSTIKTFTTLPITITTSSSNITQTKATLNATFSNVGDAVLTSNRGFKYGNTTANGIVSSIDTNTIYANLTNLSPNTTYYYRAFALLSSGDTAYGNYTNFTTATITLTAGVSDRQKATATLNGSVNYGDVPTTNILSKGFSISDNNVSATSSFSYNITGLTPHTEYYYNAFVVTTYGTFYSDTYSFTTLYLDKDGGVNLIKDSADLAMLAHLINDTVGYDTQSYKLANDITLPNTSNNIKAIGHYPDKPFMGTFDGNNHIIYNINIQKEQDSCQGLFSYTKDAGIYNLGIANITVISRKYTGGMIGYADNSYISNCYVNGGSLFATSYSGGLMGYQTAGENSTITGCYNTCEVQGNNYIGGLLGYSYKGVVKNSYVAAPIVGLGSTGIGAIIGGAVDVLTYHFYFSTAVTGQTQAVGELTSTKSTEGMNDSVMKTQAFLALLNQSLPTPLWKMDYTNPINNGFPILIWQQGSSAIENINTTNNLSVKVYPNPANDKVNITINGLNEKASLFVYDIQGRMIRKTMVNANQNNITLDVSSLCKGVYNIKIINSRNNISKRLIIQ